jgi:hypothetical protein
LGVIVPNTTVVESTKAIPNRGLLELTVTIEQDDLPLDLNGKTVTATVRREDEPDTVIDASLEDHVVALLVPDDGVGLLTLVNAELELLPVPPIRSKTFRHLVFFKVVEDDYFPEPYRLFVYGVFD